MKESTGLRNYRLDTGSMKAGLALGFIKIFSGALPADADAAETGTLICTISENNTGTGLTLNASAVAGVITKNNAVWSGAVTGAGSQVATYFRYVAVGDTGVSSTTQRRLQGTIGNGGADINFTNTTLVNAAVHPIDYFAITQPTG